MRTWIMAIFTLALLLGVAASPTTASCTVPSAGTQSGSGVTVISDLEATPPSVEGLKLLTTEQLTVFGGYREKRFLKIFPTGKLNTKKYYSLKGAPGTELKEYEGATGHRVLVYTAQELHLSIIQWAVDGWEPGSALARGHFLKPGRSKPKHWHVAVLVNGRLLGVFEDSLVFIGANEQKNISSMQFTRCDGDREVKFYEIPLPKPVRNRQNIHGAYSLYCKR